MDKAVPDARVEAMEIVKQRQTAYDEYRYMIEPVFQSVVITLHSSKICILFGNLSHSTQYSIHPQSITSPHTSSHFISLFIPSPPSPYSL